MVCSEWWQEVSCSTCRWMNHYDGECYADNPSQTDDISECWECLEEYEDEIDE